MLVTEIFFSANYLPDAVAESFSTQATHRELVLVCLGFSPPEEGELLALTSSLNLTSPIVSNMEQVTSLLAAHRVTSLPWKVTLHNDSGAVGEGITTAAAVVSSAPVSGTAGSSVVSSSELMRQGLRACNELNDFREAARCFSTLLALPTSTIPPLPPSSSVLLQQSQQEDEQRVRDALFNLASLLQMHGLLVLALPLLQRLLLREGGARDMVCHAFLWSLAQGCLPEAGGGGDSEFLLGQMVGVYRTLGQAGDVLATHKYRALTGHDLTEEEKETGMHLGEGGGNKSKGDPDYAALIFDHMAPQFEKRLVQDLHYDCPWRMKRLLEEAILSQGQGGEDSLQRLSGGGPGQWRVLDVGCGSGLIGRLFATMAGLPPQSTEALLSPSDMDTVVEQQSHGGPAGGGSSLADFASGPCMIGVDISEKMTRLAFANGGYSMTLCADLEAVLSQFFKSSISGSISKTDGSGALLPLDLLVAADTFLYVGALEETFSLARRALAPGGLFLFSTEDLDSSPMRRSSSTSAEAGVEGVELLSSARYAHSQGYIEALSARHGFSVARVESLVIRTEASVPLPGRIFLLQRELQGGS